MNTGDARLHHRLYLRARRAEQCGRRSRSPAQFALAPDAGRRRTRRSASPSPMSSRRRPPPIRRAREAAWKFVNFMAGKPYTVAKRWAVEKGLGFGQLPLFQDQDVIAAWGKWADVKTLGRPGRHRQGRHLDRVQLGLVGLLPPAARQGDGRRGARRRGDEGRRRALERAQGAVREPLGTPRPLRRAATRPPPAAIITGRPMWTLNRFPGLWLLPALLPVALMTVYPDRAMRCGPASTR